jgi:hypothetical protein
MAPIVHGLEAEYFGRIRFNYLDIDDSRTQPFQRELGSITRAEFYLIDGQGEILKKWYGFVSADDFRAAFDGALSEHTEP